MWNFKNKQTQRHLYILEEIFLYDKTLTIKELAESLECSVKTVISTIDEINLLYEDMHIYIDSNSGLIQSSVTSNFYILDIFSNFYDNILELVILENIFLYGPMSQRELSDRIYISESTLNRYLKHIQTNLEEHEIKINHKTLDLEGDEMKIRAFFIQYYKEKNACEFYDKLEDFEKVAFSMFHHLTKRSEYHIYKPFFNDFRWIMFVSLIRVSKKKYLQDSRVSTLEVVQIKDYVREQDLVILELLFGISFLDFRNFGDLMSIFRPNISSMKSFLFIQERILNMYTKILSVFDIEITEEDLSLRTKSMTTLFLSYINKPYFMFDVYVYDYNILNFHFPKAMEVIYDLVSHFYSSLNIEDSSRIYNTIQIMMRFTPEIYEALVEYEPKIKVNIFLVANKEQSQFTYNLISKRFSNLADFMLCDSDELLTYRDLKEGIWISDIATLNADNLLKIEPNIIYSEMPRIKKFLFSKRAKYYGESD